MKTRFFLCLFLLSLFSAYSFDLTNFEGRVSLANTWVYTQGDSKLYADPSFDDNSWLKIRPYETMQVSEEGYAWLRASINISSDLKNQDLYCSLSKILAVCDVYLNGSKIASRGTYPPEYYVHISKFFNFLLPPGLIKYGEKNVIAVRFYHLGPSLPMPETFIDDYEANRFEKEVRNLFSSDLYYFFTAINLFAACFFFLQFLNRKIEKINLLISLSAFFMALYFYEMGSTRTIISAWIFRPISKASLCMATVFAIDFLVTLFNFHNKKWFKAGLYSFFIGLSIMVLLSPDETVLAASFAASTYGVQIGLLFCVYLIVRSLKLKNKDTLPLAIGAAIAISLGSYDIFYGIIGREPFAWMAGIAFFAFDSSLFIMLALRSVNAFNSLEVYAKEIEFKTNEMTETNAAFSRFVPQEFLKFLGKQRITQISLGDQCIKEMTILFADIRSFTTISERLTPSENFSFLNSYFARMVPIIREEGGIIDKYIGDGVMALFPTNPESAIKAATKMRESLKEYNEGRVRAGYIPIDIGIGIHTGMLMLGTIGESKRMDSTVISDAVNVASRLEGLTKRFQVPVIVSGQTLEKIPDNRANYAGRYLGLVKIKGKEISVPIYEIITDKDSPLSRRKMATRELFERAVFYYDSGSYDAAFKEFEAIEARSPGDPAVSYYLNCWQSADTGNYFEVQN